MPKWTGTGDIGHAPAGSLRHFLQPELSNESFEAVGRYRRRDLSGRTELETGLAFDAGPAAGVIYKIEHDLVCANFGETLQPIRRLIFGPMTEAGRAAIVGDFDANRPTFMAAIRNGLVLDFESGGFFTVESGVAGRRDVVLAFKLPAADRSRLFAGDDDELFLGLIGVSVQVWLEASAPIDTSALPSAGPDWQSAVKVVAYGAKWIIENYDSIKEFVGDGLDLL